LVEARRGRRVAIIDSDSLRVISQFATPALSQVVWASRRAPVDVPEAGILGVEIGPRMLAKVAKYTGLTPDDL
jgi:hypothetical protein